MPGGCSGLDGGLVVLPAGAGVDVQVPGPLHHAVVDELRAAYEVHAQNGQRQAVQGGDDVPCRRRLRIERVKVHPVITSVMFTIRVNSPLRVGPQWATMTGLEEPRLSHGPRQPALRILMELRKPTDRPRSLTCPTAGRWPAPRRGSRRWHVAFMATRLASDSGAVAELVVELAVRLQQAWQQRNGLLEESCRTTPPLAAHTR